MTGSEATAASVSPDLLRRVMGCFPTGVTVVTSTREGERHGMTLNSLTSVSLDPPLVLVCLHNDSRTLWAVEGSRRFAINFLAQGQEEVSVTFAKRGEDHFLGMEAELDHNDPPLIKGRSGHLICDVTDLYPGGDHQIALGLVVGGESQDRLPLVFHRGRYHHLGGVGSDVEPVWYG